MRRMNIALRCVNQLINSSVEKNFIVVHTKSIRYTNGDMTSAFRSLASLTKQAPGHVPGDVWCITSDGIVTLFMRASKRVRNEH